MSSTNESITIVVDEKLCTYHENGFCMKTIDKPYGPWPCIPGKCNFSPYRSAKFLEKQMTKEELDKWAEEMREEFRREYDQLKKENQR